MQGSYDLASHTMLNIDYKKSRNCLAVMKHTDYGDIRYKFYNNFITSLESASVRDLVGSHFGDFISNPKNNLKNAILRAQETSVLGLEINFYRHTTNEPLTKDLNLKDMNYLKELIPNQLIYHNSFKNQFTLVCKNVVHNICIFDIFFDTALVSLFQKSLTGKANVFCLKMLKQRIYQTH